MSDTFTPAESKPESASAETEIVTKTTVPDKAPVTRPALDPTRYGDWEKNGRCIDF
jgi:hypothetical protein